MMADQMKKPVSPHTSVWVDQEDKTMSNKEFSLYEHKDTITSSDTIVSNTFREAADAYVAQYRTEEELRKEGAIDFAKWLAKEWMSMWVVDKWLWENVSVDTNDQTKWKGYFTEEQLYELYLEETK